MEKMLNIVLFGPPGAGKGTQSENLINKYGLVHLSTSDILRSEIARGTSLGKKAKEIIEPVASSEAADEQTYQVASAIENSLGNTGKAKRLLNEGISKFSNSGLLYNSKGNLLNADKSTKDALEA